MSYTATPTTTDGYYTSTYGYYTAPATTRNDYHAYSGETAGAGYNAYASSSSTGYTPTSAGYYQNVTTSYTPVTSGGYYSSPEQDGAWLSTGDPAAFVGAGTDYYYASESDQGHHGHPASGP
jgi:hypothetical protein